MTERQHYVSQFHLRAFADPASAGTKDPWLWIVDLETGVVKRQSPKNFGWGRGLFHCDGASENMEAFLSEKIEGPASIALRKFFDAEPGIHTELPPELTRYLSWAAARTLPMKETYAKWINGASAAGPTPTDPQMPSEVAGIRRIDRPHSMVHPILGHRSDVMSRDFDTFRRNGWELQLNSQDFLEIVRLQAWYFQTKHFPRLKWHLLRSPMNNYFVIGDRPVIWGWQHRTDLPPSVLRALGVQLLAPLTRSLALLGCHKEDEPPNEVLSKDVNAAMLGFATKWVAGPTESTLRQILSLTRDH